MKVIVIVGVSASGKSTWQKNIPQMQFDKIDLIKDFIYTNINTDVKKNRII